MEEDKEEMVLRVQVGGQANLDLVVEFGRDVVMKDRGRNRRHKGTVTR